MAHGAGNQDLACVGETGDPCAGVHCDPGRLVADDLALSRMHTRANRKIQLGKRAANRFGATNGAGRSIERGEEAIAGRVYLPTLMP